MKWFLIPLLLLTLALVQLDRHFFKQNDNFCLRTILGQTSNEPKWDSTVPLSDALRETLSQPFHYLAKGHQSYVFASADGRYVIKCYRFPSHLRLFPWLNHPIASQKRRDITTYNEEKLNLSFSSYKLACEQLQEETGTEWIHLNRTATTQHKIHLIDQTGNHYHVPLDALTLVVQKRFVMLFEALETMRANNDRKQMRELITSLIGTITHLWNQGIIDQDPVLAKNYGWDGNRIVYIDIGRFITQKSDLNLRSHIEQITPILADWLQQHDPELLAYYQKLLNTL